MVQVDVGDVEGDGAADPDSGAEQKFDEHPVALGFRAGGCRQNIEQPLLFVRM